MNFFIKRPCIEMRRRLRIIPTLKAVKYQAISQLNMVYDHSELLKKTPTHNAQECTGS
jgi:hypothetical protein